MSTTTTSGPRSPALPPLPPHSPSRARGPNSTWTDNPNPTRSSSSSPARGIPRLPVSVSVRGQIHSRPGPGGPAPESLFSSSSISFAGGSTPTAIPTRPARPIASRSPSYPSSTSSSSLPVSGESKLPARPPPATRAHSLTTTTTTTTSAPLPPPSTQTQKRRPPRLELSLANLRPDSDSETAASPPLPLPPLSASSSPNRNRMGTGRETPTTTTTTTTGEAPLLTPVGLKANPLEELIRTENLYVEDLGVVIKKVAAAWSRSNFPPKELDQMFRATEAIYRINKSLLGKLNAIGPTPSSPKALGDLLMSWIPDLTPFYTHYLTLLPPSSSPSFFSTLPSVQSNVLLPPILSGLSWPATLPQEEEEEGGEVRGKVQLETLFRLPGVRVRYYKTLFERLRRNTERGRKDWEGLERACRGLEGLVRIMEGSVAEKELPRTLGGGMENAHGERTSSSSSDLVVVDPTLPPPRIEDLERRLCTSRSLDIFTMLPKKCRLQIQPPSLPYTRHLLQSGPVHLSFVPSSSPPHSAPVVIQGAYLILLSDLFLICEIMPLESEERKEGWEMWLLYPPLAGRHLKIWEKEEEEGGELVVEVMKKEVLSIAVKGEGQRRRWREAFGECIRFAVENTPSANTATSSSSKGLRSPGVDSLQSFNSNSNGPTPPPTRPTQPRSTSFNTYTSTASPSSPAPSSYTTTNFDSPVFDTTNERTPSSLASSAFNVRPQDWAREREQTTPNVNGNGQGGFRPQHQQQQRSVSAGEGTYRPTRGTSLGPGNGTMSEFGDRVARGNSSASLGGGAGLDPRSSYYYNNNASLPLSPLVGTGAGPSYPPGAFVSRPPSAAGGGGGGYNYDLDPFPNPSFPSSTTSTGLQKSPSSQSNGSFQTDFSAVANGNGYGTGTATSRRTDPGRDSREYEYANLRTASQEAMYRSKSAVDLRERGGFLGPNGGAIGGAIGGGMGGEKRYRLPSQIFSNSNSAPGSSNGHFAPSQLDDYSPPNSPLRDSRLSSSFPSHPSSHSQPPETTTIAAQMRCKAFLQQTHAQWKSLGTAKLKLFVSSPSNAKQLVVESDKSDKKVLVSTIVLMDGVERVGKTGVAIELSDRGSRTGIVYMLQMKTEQAAIGLFEQFLVGSDRLVSSTGPQRGK